MEFEVLRQSFRGYDKQEVLAVIDSLNALVFMREENTISKEEALAEAEKIRSQPLKTVFSGFNKDDTEKYLSSVIEKISAI